MPVPFTRTTKHLIAMSTVNEKPPVEYLWEKYSYDPFTGALHRKDNDRKIKGNHSTKSHQISIHYRSRHPYAVVVWAFITGKWPEKEIDHIDRNYFNHSWWNLRQVTRRENMLNTRRARGGAHPTRSGKWRSTIRVNGNNCYIGAFITSEEARSAYKAALELIECPMTDWTPKALREAIRARLASKSI